MEAMLRPSGDQVADSPAAQAPPRAGGDTDDAEIADVGLVRGVHERATVW